MKVPQLVSETSMQIAENKVVTFHYTVKTPEGDVVDTTEGQEPLAYLHGHNQIVDGLEEALAGKTTGDHVDVDVPFAKGYGSRDPQLDMLIPMEAFPEEMRHEIQTGMMFESGHPENQEETLVFTILGIEEGKVMATGNHPLAGQDLCFSVDIGEIREATEEELSHGHVHGPNGHDHDE
jgi:FKBP-type peptidyl-prolyl cis-trans isomerase SlyD